ncbi:serine hydrolase domain-containing protein [Fulvivirgaceae bacterium BMA12]|uniref:Serine hydrolase domain-containing protein n=1 Tax=Agaribacillus aureus TaxID=3051825 RepID=A0ABT8LLL9_9BACT|nr:serine hydrolase domain-containing protein [Fulvivirgaceae bacterium BMA12]
MKRITPLVTLLTCFVITGYGQSSTDQLSSGQAAEAGMSPDILAKVDPFINSYVSKNQMPGGVFLVARKGKIVYYKNFGYRTTKQKKPYALDDIFRIASMTKAITTVSILQLFEQGKLGLDDPISRHLSAFKETGVLDTFNEVDSSYTTVPANNPITIRHLLTHTSGIVYGGFYRGKVQAVYAKHNMVNVGLSHDSWTTEAFIDHLAKVPLAFQPGEKYAYGLNMDVLGRIIEVVSGQSLSDYFTEHIFTPLEMVDSYFYLPRKKYKRLCPVYTYNQEEKMVMADEVPNGSALEYPKATKRAHFAGGGGLSSTAMDYARFIFALVNNGKYKDKRILGRKTIEMMTSDQLIALNKDGKGYSKNPGETYGLGFALLTEQGNGITPKSPGTYEWGGYFNTKFFIDPKEELIFVGMTQIVPFPHQEFWERLYAIIYASIDD